MTMSDRNTVGKDRVILGKVAKAHGIKGEVKIFPYSGKPENFHHYKIIFITGKYGAEPDKYTIEKSRVTGKFALLTLQECRSRNEAEELVGLDVSVFRNDFPELSENEFYLADLEGKNVVTDDGDFLGQICGILQTGGHDIIAVKYKGREYLVPAIKEFLIRFDANEVVVKLPPGLLDINKS